MNATIVHGLEDIAIALIAALPIAIFVVGGVWWLTRLGEGRTDREGQ